MNSISETYLNCERLIKTYAPRLISGEHMTGKDITDIHDAWSGYKRFKPARARRPQMTDAEVSLALSMHNDKSSAYRIARTLGRSESTIRRRLKSLGAVPV